MNGYMLTEKDILELIKKAKEDGYDILVRDIAYVLLSNVFESKELAYATIFFNEDVANAEQYEKNKKIYYLRDALSELLYEQPGAAKEPTYKDISFEENKDALIKMLSKIKSMANRGKISAKDAMKLETDIRIKLNEKFDVSSDKHEKRVIVNSKYNDICPYCRHEIRVKTDEDMLEEIQEKYILTPKKI